jgi:demethylmenaquinone methyltransferase/2-methoxy-6-polyprenyl-1,4-benzoquinol methylase
MYRKDAPLTIQSMFNSIANRYDLANSILSLSLHKRWNHTLVRHICRNTSPRVLVDLCSGTGDIAFNYLRSANAPCQAYLVDFSSEMLAHAQRKANQLNLHSHQLSFIEADVQHLPLPNEMADCVTIAYGIRNVQNPALCMQEVFRMLKPGGCFGILELTRPRSSLMRWGHQIYLRTLLPILGKWLTDNAQAYQYLCRSIETFIAPHELQNLLKANGFVNTQSHSLVGGIATILIGYKPTL